MSSCGHCCSFRGTKCPHCGTRVLTYEELETKVMELEDLTDGLQKYGNDKFRENERLRDLIFRLSRLLFRALPYGWREDPVHEYTAEHDALEEARILEALGDE